MAETLIQQILSSKLERDVSVGEIVYVGVDLLLGHDGTATLGVDEFVDKRKTVYDTSKVLLVADHFSPPPNVAWAQIQQKLIKFARDYKLPLALHDGICHQLVLEHEKALPYSVIVGADSHTVTAGCLGAFATGLGTTDFMQILEKGTTWFNVPESYKIEFVGERPEYIMGKDLALQVIKILSDRSLGNKDAIGKSLEYFDHTGNSISMDSRATISNMSVETGAICGIFDIDKTLFDYLASRDGTFDHAEFGGTGNYKKEISIDCAKLEPLLAAPHHPRNVKKVSELEGTPLTQVFIGTCTNGRLEDLAVAAKMLKNRKISPYTKTIVIPSSKNVYLQAMERGYIRTLLEAGALVSNPSCGPCCSIDKGLIGDGEACLATSNRNWQGRMGSKGSLLYLGSPLTAAASALNGAITDPRRYL